MSYLDESIEQLTSFFFENFITSFITQTPVEPSNLETNKKNLQKNLFLSLKKEISIITNSSSDDSHMLASYFWKKNTLANSNKFTVFIGKFVDDQTTIRNYNRFRYPFTIVLSAIQQLAISIPYRFYTEKFQISEESKEELSNILKKLETIRQRYPDLNLRTFSDCETRLYQNIADSSNSFYFPIKPLIFAPLISESDMEYYSAPEELSEKLARIIISSEGAILITGNRGVGKTTLVNNVFAKSIPKIKGNSFQKDPWKIIHVTINVAKENALKNILRLCVRSIYNTFYNLEHDTKLGGKFILSNEERAFLEWANLRASYNVNVSQSTEISNISEIQLLWGIKPSELFPTHKSVLGLLPNLESKISHKWNEKLNERIGLIDYDETRAEEDIENFIKLISERRILRDQQPIKLVIIFDELDKLDYEDQEHLFKKLKNLFLSRYSVFILITNKDFYNEWSQTRLHEDSLLGSYFSSVIVVPLFSYIDTLRLITNLTVLPIDGNKTPPATVEKLAKYITFQAGGIPRDIIREIQEILCWMPYSNKPYLSDEIANSKKVLIYSKIQEVIEDLLNPDSIIDTSCLSSNNAFSFPIYSENSYKRYLSDSGCKDQIRRGLYCVIEKLIDQKSFQFSNDFISEIQTDFFSAISIQSIRVLISNTCCQLKQHCIIDSENTASLFEIEEEDDNSFRIKVNNDFYNLTGYQQVAGKGLTKDSEPDIKNITDQINSLLEKTNEPQKISTALSLLNELLSGVNSKNVNIPENIQNSLYDIFVNNENEEYRTQAIQGVSKDFVKKKFSENIPENLISTEGNEKILLIFLDRLIDFSQLINKDDPSEYLIKFLEMHKEHKVKIPKSVIIKISAFLGKNLPENNEYSKKVLEILLENLNNKEPLDHDLISSGLLPIAEKCKVSLLAELLEKNYFFSQEQTTSDLIDFYQPQGKLLWESAVKQKGLKLSPSIQLNILRKIDQIDIGQDILEWLNSPEKDWGNQDQQILRNACANSQKMIFRLENLLIQTTEGDLTRARNRINQIQIENGPELPKPKSDEKKSKYQIQKWFFTTVLIMLIATYFVINTDLTTNVQLSNRIFSRILEVLYFVGIPAFVVVTISAISEAEYLRLIWSGVILVISSICFLINLLTIHQPITLLGQLLLFGILLLITIASGLLINNQINQNKKED
jgi:Cdc6-like AAA superfamily ATPase